MCKRLHASSAVASATSIAKPLVIPAANSHDSSAAGRHGAVLSIAATNTGKLVLRRPT